MKKTFATLALAVSFISLAGCPAPPQDAVTGADQSAIEAYQAAEDAEQAAAAGEMEEAATKP